MSRKAANILSRSGHSETGLCLGVSNRSTPIGTYDQLVDWYEKGDLDFSQVRTVNLDEYRGLERTNDQSYYLFMHEHLFDRVNIDPANTNVPDGTEPDAEKECERYERLIESMGGVDIQLLGLGHNGHIGFNEPDASLRRKHTVWILQRVRSRRTRDFSHPQMTFRDRRIQWAYGTIMRAKKILLVVNGEAKADIVAKAFFRTGDNGSTGVNPPVP